VLHCFNTTRQTARGPFHRLQNLIEIDDLQVNVVPVAISFDFAASFIYILQSLQNKPVIEGLVGNFAIF